jgi:hypothetical protein
MDRERLAGADWEHRKTHTWRGDVEKLKATDERLLSLLTGFESHLAKRIRRTIP